MRIRCTEGSVIVIQLTNGQKYVGKLKDVKPDELVLQPEYYVKEHSCTATGYNEIHVRRALLESWRYANLTTDLKISALSLFVNTAGESTFYDENGFCIGKGKDFSDVPESNG
ncbi:MAG: hypothetical protein IKL55_00450 [Clostridia bacterium]|nr:hypothetical protein [Clostridia bacterium]